MTEATRLIRGLEGVVAAETKLCDLDGANARRATFEEVCYLLWYGELPSRGQSAHEHPSLLRTRECGQGVETQTRSDLLGRR